MLKPFSPPEWMRRFMDWSVSVCTVDDPERCPRKYDYWFAGFFVCLIFTVIF